METIPQDSGNVFHGLVENVSTTGNWEIFHQHVETIPQKCGKHATDRWKTFHPLAHWEIFH